MTMIAMIKHQDGSLGGLHFEKVGCPVVKVVRFANGWKFGPSSFKVIIEINQKGQPGECAAIGRVVNIMAILIYTSGWPRSIGMTFEDIVGIVLVQAPPSIESQGAATSHVSPSKVNIVRQNVSNTIKDSLIDNVVHDPNTIFVLTNRPA
eukprot:scaffold34917_cov166-Amphora_coffeaeformis.AAC.5